MSIGRVKSVEEEEEGDMGRKSLTITGDPNIDAIRFRDVVREARFYRVKVIYIDDSSFTFTPAADVPRLVRLRMKLMREGIDLMILPTCMNRSGRRLNAHDRIYAFEEVVGMSPEEQEEEEDPPTLPATFLGCLISSSAVAKKLREGGSTLVYCTVEENA
jgi:hypothetical protein